ncbi:MAG: alpha/beta fold hydrolase [Candidatus Omnitrophota bacterium]|nr:alpha/beta fold hydrolase [Candidatus Omnitrophota bacterium]
MSQFRFIDRGYEDSMLLIPGWAADSGIFEPLDLPFNYFLPENISPLIFDEEFIKSADEFIAARISRHCEDAKHPKQSKRDCFVGLRPPRNDGLKTPGLHLFGWSMGGFIAAHLAAKYTTMFKSVTLVSVRRRYEKKVIEKIKGNIRRNARAYLYKFYEGLFSESEEGNRRWFKAKLLERYTTEMSEQVLLEGLDYLSRTELECDGLARPGIMFIHGDADPIAPIEEAKAVREGLPQAKFFSINGACHLPFLRKEFADRFSNE